jgi:hypothetical protein
MLLARFMLHLVHGKGALLQIRVLAAKPIRFQDGFEIDVINSSVGEISVKLIS